MRLDILTSTQKQSTKNAFSLSACMSVSKEKLEQIPVKPNSEKKSDKFHVKFQFNYQLVS